MFACFSFKAFGFVSLICKRPFGAEDINVPGVLAADVSARPVLTMLMATVFRGLNVWRCLCRQVLQSPLYSPARAEGP